MDAASRPKIADPVAFACAVKRHFPAIHSREALAIALHACRPGRLGSTLGGRALNERVIYAAVENHVRHQHTSYDHLIHACGNKRIARSQIRGRLKAILRAWRREVPESLVPAAWIRCRHARQRVARLHDCASHAMTTASGAKAA